MILMDTCAIIWDALEASKLSDKAFSAIEKVDEHNALICQASMITKDFRHDHRSGEYSSLQQT